MGKPSIESGKRHCSAVRPQLTSLAVLVAGLGITPRAHADSFRSTNAELLDMDDEFITGVDQPTGLAFLSDGRALITERQGQLILRNLDGSQTVAGAFAVHAEEPEQGLLNVLPHPDFENNHLLYFYYSAAASVGGSDQERQRVVTVELGDDNLLDMSTETLIVGNIMGPANHDGGGLAIYGDYLFVGTGDTGNNSFSPPGENISNYFGTCLTNANAKVLRVHLDGSIPDDNPLVGQTVTQCPDQPGIEPTGTSTSPREEIFAWGFRNPFRLWADPKTGNVWVGNVGEATFEMVQLIPPTGGLHFGWPYREGNHGIDRSICQSTVPNVGDCTDAIYICEQSDKGGGYSTPGPDDPNVPNQCDSLIGGLILDDYRWPGGLQGNYVFGDFQNDYVWTLPLNATRDAVIGERKALMRTQYGGPVSFAEFDGALYVTVHSGNGHITKISPKTPPPKDMRDPT